MMTPERIVRHVASSSDPNDLPGNEPIAELVHLWTGTSVRAVGERFFRSSSFDRRA